MVDGAGTLKRLGRILRIRADLTSTTPYFDKPHTVQKTGSLADLGLTLPQGLVTRLRPEDLSVARSASQTARGARSSLRSCC